MANYRDIDQLQQQLDSLTATSVSSTGESSRGSDMGARDLDPQDISNRDAQARLNEMTRKAEYQLYILSQAEGPPAKRLSMSQSPDEKVHENIAVQHQSASTATADLHHVPSVRKGNEQQQAATSKHGINDCKEEQVESTNATSDGSHSIYSPNSEATLPVSRRDVLITGVSTAGMMAATGSSIAVDGEASSEPDEVAETCLFTVTVTGLEIGGPMTDTMVECAGERKSTDESGTVVFEVGNGTHEVIAEADRWTSVAKTVEITGESQELHIPLHVKKYNDLTVTVYDLSCGTPLNGAAATIGGYGKVYTDVNGTAEIWVDNMLEPTEHDLEVTADNYHTEIHQVTMSDDTQRDVVLVAQ